MYPHLYAQLEGELVDDHREIERESAATDEEAEKLSDGQRSNGTWDGPVRRLQQEGWLQ